MQIRITLHSSVIYIPQPFYSPEGCGWPIRRVYPGEERGTARSYPKRRQLAAQTPDFDFSSLFLLPSLGESSLVFAVLGLHQLLLDCFLIFRTWKVSVCLGNLCPAAAPGFGCVRITTPFGGAETFHKQNSWWEVSPHRVPRVWA